MAAPGVHNEKIEMFSADGVENLFYFRAQIRYGFLSSDIVLWLLSHFWVLSNTASWPKSLHD